MSTHTQQELLVIAPEQVLVDYRSWAGQALDQALDVLRAKANVEQLNYRTIRELPAVLAQRAGRQLVLICNDATVNAVVQELHQRRVLNWEDPIGLLPAGPSNDFAKAVGIPMDLHHAAETILAGRSRPMDLLVDELGGVVINSATIGMATVPAHKHHGGAQQAGEVSHLSRLASGKPQPVVHPMTIHSPRGWQLRILVDDATLWDSTANYGGLGGDFENDSRVMFVAVGNGTTSGSDVPLMTNTAPDDGLLDVVVSVATRHEDMAVTTTTTPDAQDSTGISVESVDQQVRTARGRRVSVLSRDAAFTVLVDGEPQTGVHARTWRVEPKSWSVLAPARPQH